MNKLFPNSGFKSYINQLYIESPVFKTRSTILKTIQVFPLLIWQILMDAFIEIMLVLIFLLIVTQMSQGRDMVVSFFEPQGLYGFGRMIFTTLAIMNYSICMWLIPVFMFEYRDKLNNYTIEEGKPSESLFRKHLFFAHRILPLLPFWIYGSVIQHTPTMTIIIWVAAITELILLYFIYNKIWLKKKIRIIHWTLTVILLIVGIFTWYYFQTEYTLVKYLYIIFLFILSLVLYMSFNACDEKLLKQKEAKKTNSKWQYKTHNYIYLAMFVIQFGVLFLCIKIFDLKSVVPESLLLFVFSFYVFLIDLIHYLSSLSPKWRFGVNFIGFTLLVLIFFQVFSNYEHYRMNYLDNNKKYITEDLKGIKDYYDKWKERITTRENRSMPFPIILISGEGGGSRAGFWFSQAMVDMDSVSKGKFKDHIFSISTVSGSSVGLGAVLSYWTFCQENNLEIGKKKWNDYPSRIFRYNFVGGSILGFTITDFFKSLVPGVDWINDRNSELQNEEAICIQRAIHEIHSEKFLPVFNLLHKKAGIPTDSLIMNRDFLSFYYKGIFPISVELKTDLPLCFVNTCRSNDGRRGIFSPVRLENYDFMDAIDLTRYIYTQKFKNGDKDVKGLNKAVSLGTVCNTSELFPFLSAPAFIDNLGYFVDGGYHDNSGLKTTLEVYSKLSRMLKEDGLVDNRDYTISVIYIKNGKYEKKYYPDTVKPTMPGLQPIVAISNIPFNGNASFFEEKASHDLKENFIRFQLDYDRLLDFEPDSVNPIIKKHVKGEILEDIYSVNKTASGNDTTMNFPLARWLSSYVIGRMRKNCQNKWVTEKRLLDIINRIKEN